MTYKYLTTNTVIRVEYDKSSGFSCSIDNPHFLEWLAAGNSPLPADPPSLSSVIEQAEAHIAAHFSTPRLLQMKVWYDEFPHEDVPKLDAVFDWTASITIKAAQGKTNFGEPPHTFEELVAEAMFILGVDPNPTEPEPEPEQ